MALPSGVRSFNAEGKGQNTKGKAHPGGIAAGLETTSKTGGSVPPAAKAAGSGSSIPGGVHKHSGKEELGSKSATMQGKTPKAGKGNAGGLPAGVSKHDGTRAPKRAK